MSDPSTGSRLTRVVERLREFVRERDWAQFHDPKNLSMAIASEAGELVAELRWVASSIADEYVRDPANRIRIEREIGDVGIALLLFCDRSGIDLFDAVEKKLALNAERYPVEASRGRSSRPRESAD